MDVDGTSTPRRVSKAKKRKRGTSKSTERRKPKKMKQLEESLSGQPKEKGGKRPEQKWAPQPKHRNCKAEVELENKNLEEDATNEEISAAVQRILGQESWVEI
ncbi:hypothetical protein KM043_015803 [Ampulex compressa]|nr:hypothetical protein KM043_015803 [Ampulex compressa]